MKNFGIALVAIGILAGIVYLADLGLGFSESRKAGQSRPESGRLQPHLIGSMTFQIPAEWETYDRESYQVKAAQAGEISETNDFLDNLHWAVLPIKNDGSDYENSLATAFDSKANFKTYLRDFIIPPMLRRTNAGNESMQTADDIVFDSIQAVSKDGFSGYDVALSGFELNINGKSLRLRARFFIVKAGDTVVNGLFKYKDARASKQMPLIQKCIDESFFRAPET